MKKREKIYIFVEKNMGHGFEMAYPPIPWFKRVLCKFLMSKCSNGLSKHFGVLIYRHIEIDNNCTDPRAQGRSPKIEMTAVFPWLFNEQNLFSETGNQLLDTCRNIARNIAQKGKSEELAIDLPVEWYKTND